VPVSDYRDIVIAGGGMAGISLALALGHRLPRSVSILLVEKFELPGPDAGTGYHPSFDARSTALSFSSRLIYEGIGVWQQLDEWLCAIERIHVSSRGRFGSTVLRAADHDWPALGYVVENAWLGSALARALYAQGRVEVASPAQIVGAQARGAAMRLQLDAQGGSELDAGLLVVADGAHSPLCDALGIVARTEPYDHHAVVANVATDRAHEGCAFERFTDEGPLAMLPLLSAPGAEHRSALVWTLPGDRAGRLTSCDARDFLDSLQERFGYRLGRLYQVGERYTYPLALVQSTEQVRRGVVVMGNAAHALHPVAGQGFNLALRDISELAAVLADGIAAGRATGDLSVLERYCRRQRTDQARTIGFSDRLPGLFMHPDPLLGIARDLALSGLDLLPRMKREFARHTAGVAALRSSSSG